jgi:uncharacterized protein (UPF0261 family)
MADAKTIVLVGTLDTKGEEIGFLRDFIQGRGHNTLILDTGILGQPLIEADVSRQELAREGGTAIETLREKGDEAFAQQVMAEGLKKVVLSMAESGRIHGLLAIGGGQGSTIVAPTLKSMELGFPKLLVSTKVTQAGARPYIGPKDVLILPPVADLAGINRLTRRILANAAGAMVGMVETTLPRTENRPLAVVSMNGTVTECGLAVKGALEASGYEVLVFHTIGTGGEALEDYVAANEVAGVVELAVNEIGNDLLGGLATAGPHRLETAAKRGLPMVVVPGSADFINFLGPETVPARYRHRKVHYHNPKATCIRTTVKDNRELGRVIAKKLNQVRGPIALLWPARGLSSWDCEGKPFYDLEADSSLLGSLKRYLKPHVPIKEFDLHINDPAFAESICEAFRQISPKTS